MECSKSVLFFLNEAPCVWWHFQKELNAILPKLKAQLENLLQIQWSAGFEILLRRRAPQCWRIPESAEGGKEHEDCIYYVLRRLHRSLLSSVYTALTLHTPEQFVQLWSTTKNTFSTSSARPYSSHWSTRNRDSMHWETSIILQFCELFVFSLCTFVLIKIYMSWDTNVKHDPNRMGLNKAIISTVRCGNWKMSLWKQSYLWVIISPIPIRMCSNTEVQYDAFCNSLCQLFCKGLFEVTELW